MRVLLAEDDEGIRLTIRVGLDAEVTEAPDGYTAMRALVEDGPFDVLLADVMMPGMSGLELVAAVRESARFADLPVVMLTSLGRECDISAGLQAGADAYVTKPFDPLHLQVALEKVVERPPELRAAQRAAERAQLPMELGGLWTAPPWGIDPR